MKLVMLAAGRGSRFIDAGILTPKPLVIFRGYPLFWWAAKSALSSNIFHTIEFVVLQEHVNDFDIVNKIEIYFPNAVFKILEEVTGGAAETAALISKDFSPDEAIAFCDCDLGFAFKKPTFLNDLFRTPISAAVCIFSSSNPAYSYALINHSGYLSKVVEKKIISKNAIAGLYFFSSVEIFLSEFFKYKKRGYSEELYLSGVLNEMINSGQLVGYCPIVSHLSLGTPEELRLAYEKPLPKWGH